MIHKTNPFHPFQSYDQINATVAITRISSLSSQGISTLAAALRTYDSKNHTVTITVKDLCLKLWDDYNETLAARIRRGIKNLLLNSVIAYSEDVDVYFLNTSVIWNVQK